MEGEGDAPVAQGGVGARPGLTAARGESGAVFEGAGHAARSCVVVSLADARRSRMLAGASGGYMERSSASSRRDLPTSGGTVSPWRSKSQIASGIAGVRDPAIT